MPRKPTRQSKVQLNMWIDKEVADRIQDLRFANRVETKTEVIEYLLRKGMEWVEANGFDLKQDSGE